MPGYRCVPLLQALNGYQLEEEGEEGEGRGTQVEQEEEDKDTKELGEKKEESHEEGSLRL